jgi:hypothetical protein
MGYHQSIIVSSVLDWAAREDAIQRALSRWPFLRCSPNWRKDSVDRLLLAPPELTTYLFGNEEDYEAAVEHTWSVESELLNWSQGFPSTTFAFVEADCFGGNCVYSGFACRDGTRIESPESSPDAHLKLLRHVGIETAGSFEPFKRGYFM